MPDTTLPVQKPPFREAFLFWLKLGFISFGGPAGQIAIMRDYVVDRKKWISDSRFLHALNYCMLLPGPEAQQLATYIGWLLHGVGGGLAAGILFVLPSVFILMGLSAAYVVYGALPWVYALFYGLKAAVVAIVVLALIKIAKKSLRGPLHYAVAALSFTGIYFLNIPFPYIILGAVGLALLVMQGAPALLGSPQEEARQTADERGYYLNRDSVVTGAGFNAARLGRQLLAFGALWALPLGLFYALTADYPFWSRLSLFFTQAAFVTIGGAYAVLPYVAQVAVEKLGWLSGGEMIDGLALGETTPGPLVMVLAFVGFMAGYHHAGGSLSAGALGLLTTTFYTFLPCFLFILAGAPVIERTRRNAKIQSVLGLVTAAVVGVVLNLTVYFGKAVVFPEGRSAAGIDWFSLAWIVVSLAAMYRFRVGMIPWIGISALAGLAWYLFGPGR